MPQGFLPEFMILISAFAMFMSCGWKMYKKIITDLEDASIHDRYDMTTYKPIIWFADKVLQ